MQSLVPIHLTDPEPGLSSWSWAGWRVTEPHEALLLTLKNSQASGQADHPEKVFVETGSRELWKKVAPRQGTRSRWGAGVGGKECKQWYSLLQFEVIISSLLPHTWLLFHLSHIFIYFSFITFFPLSLPEPIRMRLVRCVRVQGILTAVSSLFQVQRLGSQLALAVLSPLSCPSAAMSPKSAFPALNSEFFFLVLHKLRSLQGRGWVISFTGFISQNSGLSTLRVQNPLPCVLAGPLRKGSWRSRRGSSLALGKWPASPPALQRAESYRISGRGELGKVVQLCAREGEEIGLDIGGGGRVGGVYSGLNCRVRSWQSRLLCSGDNTDNSKIHQCLETYIF